MGLRRCRRSDQNPAGGDRGHSPGSLRHIQAISNTSLQRSIGTALEGYGLPVLRSGTTQRVAYATTAAQGMTVFDGRRTVARQEMEAIREEVKEMMYGAQSEA